MRVSWPLIVGTGLVGVAVGIWLARRSMARRLRAVADVVLKLGQTPVWGPLPDRPPELSQLAGAVNKAAARLADEAERSHEQQGVRDLIFSSMQEGVLLAGDDGRVVFANDALVRHLGTRPSSVTGVFPLGLRSALERAARDRAPISVEVEAGSPTRWLRGTAVPATEGSSVLLVVRDVTEAKRLEAVRRDFVANASHELKTPAASIQATAETILRAADDDPAVVPKFAEQLEREAIRLSRIVADLLDLSRLEAGSELAELVRLDALVREEVGRFETPAREAGVELAMVAPAMPEIRGSGRDLTLLVRNLIDNAIRYTKPGGRVHVAVADCGDGDVALQVADTGMGIPSRDLGRIFERFYRIDRARSRETGGTGLGLAIVKHVAENHGGRVSVQSELGRGTTFEVRLPRSAPRSPVPAPAR
jgi:signal transduction histidine kinase